MDKTYLKIFEDYAALKKLASKDVILALHFRTTVSGYIHAGNYLYEFSSLAEAQSQLKKLLYSMEKP